MIARSHRLSPFRNYFYQHSKQLRTKQCVPISLQNHGTKSDVEEVDSCQKHERKRICPPKALDRRRDFTWIILVCLHERHHLFPLDHLVALVENGNWMGLLVIQVRYCIPSARNAFFTLDDWFVLLEDQIRYRYITRVIWQEQKFPQASVK